MALKNRLSPASSNTGIPCSVGRALKGLPPDDRKVFVDLLGTTERPGRPASYIYAMMQAERRELIFAASAANERGERDEAARLQSLAEVYDVGHQTINRHRGENCRCFKDAA